MCDMRNSATLQEIHTGMHRQIPDRGFTIMRVEGHNLSDEWAYTVGLLHGFDHPELVVAGYQLDRASIVLQELAAKVVKGGHRPRR